MTSSTLYKHLHTVTWKIGKIREGFNAWSRGGRRECKSGGEQGVQENRVWENRVRENRVQENAEEQGVLNRECTRAKVPTNCVLQFTLQGWIVLFPDAGFYRTYKNNPSPPPTPLPPPTHIAGKYVLSLYNIQCDNTVSMQTLVRAQCNFMPLECSQPSVIGRGQTIAEAFNLSLGLGGEWCKVTQYHFRASNRTYSSVLD